MFKKEEEIDPKKQVHDQITLRFSGLYTKFCYICNRSEIRDNWKEIHPFYKEIQTSHKLWLCPDCREELENKYGKYYIQKVLNKAVEDRMKAFEQKIINEMNHERSNEK